MADQSVRGRFVWHELLTPDANAAHAFYSKAIGWKSQPWEEDPSYVMFAASRGPIGATVTAADDTAPHWLPYVGTGDIAETVDLAKQKGGRLVKDITSMSSGSKYAVLNDPYGAVFGVYESAEDYGQVTPPKPGEHSWHELMTTDYAGAFEFYSELFGWEKMAEHDMGDMGVYLIYGKDGVQLGGMMNFKDAPPAWMGYVQVKDVNQTAKKVKSAGGRIANGPMEVPGGDWIVQLIDPQGAMFAVHATAASMKKPAKSAAGSSNGATEPEAAAEAPAEKPKKKSKPAKVAAAEQPPPMIEEEPAEEPAQPPAKKAPAKKSPARKAPAKKSPARKAPAKKSPAKKAPGKKQAVSKKAPAKSKVAGKKKSAKKSRKAPAKGAGSKKTAARNSARKGAKQASKKAATKQTRSGGKKKAAKKPRKGK